MSGTCCLHSPHATPLHSVAIQGWKKLSKMQLYYVGHVTQTVRPWQDYITAFHLVGQPLVKDSQPCATDMDSGLCSLLNACGRVTITYRHADATEIFFDVADVRIGLTLAVISVFML